MPFTVTDFQDLLRLLREHPDWRAQLWGALAGEELLRLPGEFAAHRQEFAAFRAETEQRFAELAGAVRELAEAQRRHYEEFAAFRAETDRRFAELREEVAAARAEADRRFAELAEAQRRTEEVVRGLAEKARQLADVVGEHRGLFLEMRYRERPHAYFHRIVERPRRVEAAELEDLLEGHALAPSEEDRLRQTDLLLRGRREGRETWLAVEISYGIGPGDVRRALRSAEALRKLGVEALPVVAGAWLTGEAETEARGRVWRVLDGRVYPPEAEAPTGPAAGREEDG